MPTMWNRNPFWKIDGDAREQFMREMCAEVGESCEL